MCHIAGQAVQIHGKGVYRHVFQQIVHVHVSLKIRALCNVFQSRYHTLVIRFGGIRHLAVPYGRIAVQFIVCILQISTSGSAERRPGLSGVRVFRQFGQITPLPAEPVSGRRLIAVRSLRQCPAVTAIAAVSKILSVRRSHALHLRRVKAFRHLAGLLGGVQLNCWCNTDVFPCVFILYKVLFLVSKISVFAATTAVYPFGLIEFPTLRTAVAQQKTVLYCFQRQIGTPVLAVDIDGGVVIQGGVRPQKLIHVVHQRFLHAGGVGIVVVQHQFIQSVAGLTVHILVKLQLEAVAVRGGIAGDGAQAGVSFWTNAHPVESLTVDLHVAGIVFLRRGVVQHLLPVGLIHEDIDGQRLAGVKQRLLIFHGDAADAEGLFQRSGTHGGRQTQAHSHRHDRRRNLCHMLMCDHPPVPPSRQDMYSPL